MAEQPGSAPYSNFKEKKDPATNPGVTRIRASTVQTKPNAKCGTDDDTIWSVNAVNLVPNSRYATEHVYQFGYASRYEEFCVLPAGARITIKPKEIADDIIPEFKESKTGKRFQSKLEKQDGYRSRIVVTGKTFLALAVRNEAIEMRSFSQQGHSQGATQIIPLNRYDRDGLNDLDIRISPTGRWIALTTIFLEEWDTDLIVIHAQSHKVVRNESFDTSWGAGFGFSHGDTRMWMASGCVCEGTDSRSMVVSDVTDPQKHLTVESGDFKVLPTWFFVFGEDHFWIHDIAGDRNQIVIWDLESLRLHAKISLHGLIPYSYWTLSDTREIFNEPDMDNIMPAAVIVEDKNTVLLANSNDRNVTVTRLHPHGKKQLANIPFANAFALKLFPDENALSIIDMTGTPHSFLFEKTQAD